MKLPQFALALAICLLSVGCASNAIPPDNGESAPTEEQTSTAFDLQSFKANIKPSVQAIYDDANLLYNVANYESGYFTARSNVVGSLAFSSEDRDSMIESAFNWLEKKSGTTRFELDARYDDIRQQYKEITLTEFEGKEAEEIYNSYKELYDGYSSLRGIVLSPAPPKSAFDSTYHSYVNDIVHAYDNLTLFLDE